MLILHLSVPSFWSLILENNFNSCFKVFTHDSNISGISWLVSTGCFSLRHRSPLLLNCLPSGFCLCTGLWSWGRALSCWFPSKCYSRQFNYYLTTEVMEACFYPLLRCAYLVLFLVNKKSKLLILETTFSPSYGPSRPSNWRNAKFPAFLSPW